MKKKSRKSASKSLPSKSPLPAQTSPPHSIPILALFIIFSFGAGAIGSIFTFDAIPTWYSTLQKPFFSPPNWVFGPVWTTLYLLIGISAYLAWRAGAGRKGLIVFLAQAALNALWSILFFGLKMPLLAFIELVLLLACIAYMAKLFQKYDRLSAYMLVPYILWVSFASLLNLAIVLLN